MKKVFTMALCALAVCSASAQKANVDQAKKMTGDIAKVAEARQLINQAMTNPETQNDPQTYFVAGNIEYGAYDKAFLKKSINPDDKDVNDLNMAEQIINGYKNMVKVLPLDQLPDAKGKVKPKYTKNALKQINDHFNDLWAAGSTFFTNKKYPEAYEAFTIFGTLPRTDMADKTIAAQPDSVLGQAFFWAGASASYANNHKDAAAAFKKARLSGNATSDVFHNEISSLTAAMQQDSTFIEEGKKEILELSHAGLEKFGISDPLFVINIVNTLMDDNKADEAINLVNGLESKYGNTAMLLSLKGFVFDRMGKDDESVAAYKDAVAREDADFDVLKRAALKLLTVGSEKFDALQVGDKEGRLKITNEYFIPAKEAAAKAKSLNPTDNVNNTIVDRIDYLFEQYLNN